MGEIADAMIEGSMCSHCGTCFREDHGYPVLCNSCFDDETEKERAGLQRATLEEI